MTTPTRAPGPVYVLGSGFSRAVSNAMPVTRELGEAIANELGVDAGQFEEAGGFEQFLSNLVTRMPFLPGHENDRRTADASRIIAEVATHLDERELAAARLSAPKWLEQLVALWHAEKATVITFNYDTLVERAVNASPHLHEGEVERLSKIGGGQVARPAPRLDEGSTYSSIAPATRDSMLLVKLHGSLNWFWKSGEHASAVRVHSDARYETDVNPLTHASFGTELLDRLLVPPVYSKDSYYSSTLNEQLWRTAGDAIANATEINILGYSLPNEDRVVGELLRLRPETCAISVVNLDPGSEENANSPIGRLTQLGARGVASWPGPSAVQDFTAARIEAARQLQGQRKVLRDLGRANVVISIAGADMRVRCFCVWATETGLRSESLDANKVRSSGMPPNEVVHQNVAVTGAQLEDFLTAQKLVDLLSKGVVPEVEVMGKRVAPIGMVPDQIGSYQIIRLLCSPIE